MAKKKKSKKGGRSKLKIVLYLFLSLLILVSAGFYFQNKIISWIFPPVRYAGFSAKSPEGYKIRGIDVSKYQGRIDWKEVKKMKSEGTQIHFVFAKATEGISMTDRNYHRNRDGAKKQGLVFGAYHYFLPKRDIQSQAHHFIKNAELKKGDLPPVVDIEDAQGLSATAIRSKLKLFLVELENHYGIKPIIYTYINFYETYLNTGFNEYDFWIAHYYKSSLRVPSGMKWKFWQYTDKGTVNGIKTRTDLNVFNGDSLALERMKMN